MNAFADLAFLTPNNLLQTLNLYPTSRYLLGFSGGRDSHVLLNLLVMLRESGELSTEIRAIHVNHCLQADADHWVRHCQNVCQDYQIPLIIETVATAPSAGESIEAFARKQRYALIEKHLASGDIFLSAHHQRDQAETFLLQLMRGAGLDGLCAMPLIKPFGAGQYLRPLLSVPYAEIVAYAEVNRLDFIDDDSNQNTRFDRNFIRHEVLPILESRFSAAQANIAQSAKWLQEVPDLFVPHCLRVADLQLLPDVEKKQQIRAFIKSKTGMALSQSQTNYIVTHHLHAAADRQPMLALENYVIRRFENELIVTNRLPSTVPAKMFVGSVAINQARSFVEIGELTWESGHGVRFPPIASLQLRALTGGLRFHPHTRSHSTTVKKLLHECGIAPWLRPWYFGLFDSEELVAIPGLGVAKSHYGHGADAYLPLWQIAPKFARL